MPESNYNPYKPGVQQGIHAYADEITQSDSELDFAGLVFRIFSIYRHHYLTLILTALVYVFLIVLLYGVVFVVIYQLIPDFLVLMEGLGQLNTIKLENLWKQALEQGLYVFTVLSGAVVAFLLIQVVFQMVSVLQVGDWEMGEKSLPDMYAKKIMMNLPVFIVSSLLFWVFAVIGLFFCIVPGVVLLIYYMFLIPQLLIGNQGFNGIAECFYILKQRFFKTAGIFVMLYLLQFIVGLVLNAPLNILSEGVISELLKDLTVSSQNVAEVYRELVLHPLVILPYLLSVIMSAVWLSLSSVSATVMYIHYKNIDQKNLGIGPDITEAPPSPVVDKVYN